MAPERRWCKQGLEQGACIRYHVRERVPPARPKSGTDRECPGCQQNLSINKGRKGMWVVWCCPNQKSATCDPATIRGKLLDLGIDAECLGSYGSDDWQRNQERKQPSIYHGPDSSTLAAVRRSYVIEKLYLQEFDSLTQLQVCIRAVFESDGDISPDPAHLLPADYRELAALARRAGVERCYSYRFAREFMDWLAQ